MKVNKKVFAENLRAERDRLGWTQQQMADKNGISYRKYFRWEDRDDHLWPDVGEFYQLGDIIGIDPNYLVGHAPFMREANKEIKLKRMYQRIIEDKDFYMFVYAAMNKSNDALSALLTYWMIETHDSMR